MEKHIGGRMKKEPELIGGKTCARGAVRQQMILVLLYHKFHGSPAGVDHLIDDPAVPVLQVGYDNACVGSKGIVFDFGNDSASPSPGLGFIESLGEQFNRTFLQVEPLGGLLEKRLDFSDQGGEGLKPQDILHVVVFTIIKDRRTGVVRICPQKDPHFRPGLSDFSNHPLEDGDDLFACRTLPRPQHCGDQFAASPFIDMDGHIAVVAVVGIEKPQLLTAVGQVIGVIDIQNDALRRFAVRVNKHIDEHFRDPVKVCPGETVFKPADGRLAGQGRILLRQSLTGYFHDRIFPQSIAVICVFITAGDLENPLLEKLEELMSDITGVAPVPQGLSHFPDKPYPIFNLPEEQKPGIGTDLTAIKIGLNFFIGNAFKKEELFGTIFHGCFLFLLLLTYYISIRYEGKQLFL
jgi:hypothetical protein